MNVRKVLYYVLVFFIIYFAFINDPLYFLFGKKYGSGIITNVELQGCSEGGCIYEIEYSFIVNGKNYHGNKSIDGSWFNEGYLKVGDTVHCIYYCPCYPDMANGFDIYYFMNPKDGTVIPKKEQQPLKFIEGCD